MNNYWTNHLNGYVRVRIDGDYPERFLNRCIEHDISIWQIKRIGDKRIVCYMDVEDAKRIRPLLRQTSCKVTFVQRRGVPFLLKRILNRSGFVAGIAAFLVVMFVLSNMVWNVEIKGASPQVEHELRQVVSEMGIKRGTFQFSLPSVELIQRDVTELVQGATWVGVRQKGTTYEFEVVEQQLPEEADRYSPRHLVASKKAIIHKIFVEHGQAEVKPNDFVRKGDRLVSGYIGKKDAEDEEKQLVPAQAVVLGEIWYKSDVSVPLDTLFTTLTGEKKVKSYVELWGLDIPIWGFGKTEFPEFTEFTHQRPFQFFKWTMPISYKRVELLETSQYERTYTKEEAVRAARERARDDLRKHLPKDAEIIGEKVLHEDVENGKVNLRIHYQVIEDITSEQPIIQGD
ncbi:sporulation protein YqfD [Halalkalibacter krulwichiae]|uniref:Putative stage IV sporulation protein YqfD n=1 Tax=Halalkalibacter krulwichiae TaxID=199441 RepID=A0A1X9M7C5_9BACI|nr:sporulation protein YqfD [Halalkalibacter krulwichiae]ARK29328.1 Putative stage IV sporulation protein YqfD [Halalkalibacter krulwichiae]